MTGKYNKSHLDYLNQLGKYNNTYHFIEKRVCDADYSALTEKLNRVIKFLMLVIETGLLFTRIFLVKVTLKIGHEKYLSSIGS